MDLTEYYPLLQKTALFAGFSDIELGELLTSLGPICRTYVKGEQLVRCGDSSASVGILLQGSIEAVRPLPGGKTTPISRMGPGGVYGDVLGGANLKSPVTVTAAEPCTVLLLPCCTLLSMSGSPLRARLLQNLIASLSNKYFALFRRIELLTTGTLRGKISSYLLMEADAAGSDTFTIPYTRAALAEYLGCERSALSRELSAMQRSGLIETWKNSFRLADRVALEAACSENS